MKIKAKTFYSKISMMLAMFAMLIATLMPAVGGAIVRAGTPATSNVITVSDIQTEGLVGEAIQINKASVNGVSSNDVRITITDKYNNAQVCGEADNTNFKGDVEANANGFAFTPLEKGNYKVVYAHEPPVGSSVFTKEYNISVTAPTASFEEIDNQYLQVVSGGGTWVDNNEIVYPIIPSLMNDSQEFVYYVPVMKATDENGNDLNVTIQIFDKNEELLASENIKTLAVKLNGIGSELTTYAFKPLAGEYGSYKIVYTATVMNELNTMIVNTIKTSVDFSVCNQTSFNPKTDLTFTSLAFASSFPDANITAGKELSVPKLNVVQTNNRNQETITDKFFTKVKFYKNNGSGLQEFAGDGYSFIVELNTDYYVEYTVIDAFGNEKSLDSRKAILSENILDNEAPTVQVVQPYAVTSGGALDTSVNGEDDLISAVNEIPSKFYQQLVGETLYYHNGTSYVDADGVAVTAEDKVAVNDMTYVASFEIPAIYASDNISILGDATKPITMHRTISYEGVSDPIDLDKLSTDTQSFADRKVIVLGVNTGRDASQQNERLTLYFAEAGTYTLTYYAKDNAGKSSETLTYSIVIAESTDIDDTLPVIATSQAIPTKVLEQTQLSFTVPTATDDSDGSRINCYTAYFFNTATVTSADSVPNVSSTTDMAAYLNGDNVTFDGLQALVNAGKLTLLNESNIVDGKYSINVGDHATNTSITIVSYARDKYNATYGNNTTKNVGLLVRNVMIVEIAEETNSPDFIKISRDTVNYNYQTYTTDNNQEEGFYNISSNPSWTTDLESELAGAFVNVYADKPVHLPHFHFEDEDANVVVKAQIYREDTNGDMIFVEEFNLATTKDASASPIKYATEYASFTPTYGDTAYKIVILATDSYQNLSCIAFDFDVNEWLEIDTYLDYDFPTISELNEEIDLPSMRVIAANKSNSGQDITDTATITLELINNIGEFREPNGFFKFKGNEHKKVYSFKYTINVAGMKEPLVLTGDDYKITVEDTIKPTIEVANGEYDDRDEITMALVKTGSSYNDIQFPYFTVTDADVQEQNKSFDVTYDKNGASITATLSTDKTKLEFNPSYGDGRYTIKYTAVDDNGLTTNKTYILAVGDTVKPIITIGDANKFETQSLNSTITINTTSSGVSVYDLNELDEYGSSSAVRYFDLVITAPSGDQKNLSELTDNKYTFIESGTYTFTYTAKDKAGNVTTEIYRVAVNATEVAEEEDDEKGSIVWPIIIIILSLAILGFVVWYFLVDHKKKVSKREKKERQPKEKKSRKAKKQKSDDDKIVV